MNRAAARPAFAALALAALAGLAGCPPVGRTPCQAAYDRITEAYVACNAQSPLTTEPQQCTSRDQQRTECDAACTEAAGCGALTRTDAEAEQRYAQCLVDCRAALP